MLVFMISLPAPLSDQWNCTPGDFKRKYQKSFHFKRRSTLTDASRFWDIYDTPTVLLWKFKWMTPWAAAPSPQSLFWCRLRPKKSVPAVFDHKPFTNSVSLCHVWLSTSSHMIYHRTWLYFWKYLWDESLVQQVPQFCMIDSKCGPVALFLPQLFAIRLQRDSTNQMWDLIAVFERRL